MSKRVLSEKAKLCMQLVRGLCGKRNLNFSSFPASPRNVLLVAILLRKHISSYQISLLFPDVPRSTRVSTLKRLMDDGLVKAGAEKEYGGSKVYALTREGISVASGLVRELLENTDVSVEDIAETNYLSVESDEISLSHKTHVSDVYFFMAGVPYSFPFSYAREQPFNDMGAPLDRFVYSGSTRRNSAFVSDAYIGYSMLDDYNVPAVHYMYIEQDMATQHRSVIESKMRRYGRIIGARGSSQVNRELLFLIHAPIQKCAEGVASSSVRVSLDVQKTILLIAGMSSQKTFSNFLEFIRRPGAAAVISDSIGERAYRHIVNVTEKLCLVPGMDGCNIREYFLGSASNESAAHYSDAAFKSRRAAFFSYALEGGVSELLLAISNGMDVNIVHNENIALSYKATHIRQCNLAVPFLWPIGKLFEISSEDLSLSKKQFIVCGSNMYLDIIIRLPRLNGSRDIFQPALRNSEIVCENISASISGRYRAMQLLCDSACRMDCYIVFLAESRADIGDFFVALQNMEGEYRVDFGSVLYNEVQYIRVLRGKPVFLLYDEKGAKEEVLFPVMEGEHICLRSVLLLEY